MNAMNTDKCCITESSKNYCANTILLHFEGEVPSNELLIEFLKNTYDCSSFSIEGVDPADELNCGSIYIKIL